MDSDADLRDDFEAISAKGLTDDDYTNALEDISNKLVDYIIDNPDTMVDKNEIDSRDYDYSELEDNQPEYDLEISLPENVKAHLDNDDISYRDLQWEIGSWEISFQGSIDDCSSSIDVSPYGVSIYGLNRDAYNELDRLLYDWLEQYGEDLDNDYGVPGEEDDEYDDETYEEVDESLNEDYYVLETNKGLFKVNGKVAIFDGYAEAEDFAELNNLGEPIAYAADEDDIANGIKMNETVSNDTHENDNCIYNDSIYCSSDDDDRDCATCENNPNNK